MKKLFLSVATEHHTIPDWVVDSENEAEHRPQHTAMSVVDDEELAAADNAS